MSVPLSARLPSLVAAARRFGVGLALCQSARTL